MEDWTCAICFTSDGYPMILVSNDEGNPCGHEICSLCLEKLANRTCPECRQAISKSVPNRALGKKLNKEWKPQKDIKKDLDNWVFSMYPQVEENAQTSYVSNSINASGTFSDFGNYLSTPYSPITTGCTGTIGYVGIIGYTPMRPHYPYILSIPPFQIEEY